MLNIKKIMKMSPQWVENFHVAVNSIKSNKLRSLLTVITMTIGITALIGVLTATDALKSEIFRSFDNLGVNQFTIREKSYSAISENRRRIRNKRGISFYQAEAFKKNFDIPSIISVYSNVDYSAVFQYAGKKTVPNYDLVAADENYSEFSKYLIGKGRDISGNDVDCSSYVCVIGSNVANALYGSENPIGKFLQYKGYKFVVIGVYKKFGSSFGGGADEDVVIPVSTARASVMTSSGSSFRIGVVPEDKELPVEMIDGRAEQLFRSIRRLTPIDETDFDISKSDALLSKMSDISLKVTLAAFAIGLITLLGSAISLMNIMLVSVTERTNEIGIRKAIGASQKKIRQQFLMESVLISQIGCVAGTVLGLIIGNIIAMLIHAPFLIPWIWIISAIAICLFVGVSSGYLPAKRAASLDPIEALRYE
jgi:putative ABC transport system permease protein